MSKVRLLVALIILAPIAAFFLFDLGQYADFDYFQAKRAAIEAYRVGHPVAAAVAYFALYVAVTSLSLPGAALLTVIAGAIFGLFWGTVIVSFASSIGATVAFLASRFLFRDAIQRRFGDKLRTVNAGVEKEGAFYLFALRLVPAFPYFVVNLVMGLTPIRVWTYYWVSQLAMLVATVVYVNAGTIGAEIQLPFGGMKATGNGHREAGRAALDVYSEWKSIYVDYSGKLQRAQMDTSEGTKTAP